MEAYDLEYEIDKHMSYMRLLGKNFYEKINQQVILFITM